MSGSNAISNNGPPYKESNTIAGHAIEGDVRIDGNNVIHVTRKSGEEVPLHTVFQRFGLPRTLLIDITTPHRSTSK